MRKITTSGTAPAIEHHYCGGIEYKNGLFDALYHSEGRVRDVEGLIYEYTLRDHLGNGRVYYTDQNNDGVATVTDILQDNHYYPFGLNIDDPRRGSGAPENLYQYNGKELNRDLGLDWSDYGARWYDARLGRWWSVDKLSDHPNQIDKSPMAYLWNTPTNLNDPDENCPTCPAAALGAAIGGFIGGGFEIGKQLWNEGEVSDWNAVKGNAIQGAVTGGAVGLSGGSSLFVTAAASGTANAAGGALNRTIQGQETTVGDVAVDGTIGVLSGVAGGAFGNTVKSGADDLSNAAKGRLGEAVTEAKYALKGYRSQGKAVVPTGGRTATGKVQVAKYDHSMENVFTGKQLTVESKFNTSQLTPNQRAAQNAVTTKGGLIIDRTTSQGLGNAAQSTTGGTTAGAGTQLNNQ